MYYSDEAIPSPCPYQHPALPDLELGTLQRFGNQEGFPILGIDLVVVEAVLIEDPVYADIIESSSLLDLICFHSTSLDRSPPLFTLIIL